NTLTAPHDSSLTSAMSAVTSIVPSTRATRINRRRREGSQRPLRHHAAPYSHSRTVRSQRPAGAAAGARLQASMRACRGGRARSNPERRPSGSPIVLTDRRKRRKAKPLRSSVNGEYSARYKVHAQKKPDAHASGRYKIAGDGQSSVRSSTYSIPATI